MLLAFEMLAGVPSVQKACTLSPADDQLPLDSGCAEWNNRVSLCHLRQKISMEPEPESFLPSAGRHR